jgi:hypothetical protein
MSRLRAKCQAEWALPGNSTINVAPWPISLSTQMRPP